MDSLTVMMSTYNGELYLKEQIDSILSQQDVQLELYIRDDGSSDGTIDILDEYSHLVNIHVCLGNNIGVIKSFEELILTVPHNSEYYAFADQDDIWYSNKLSAAVKMIKEHNNDVPLLYSCNQNCVDSNGVFLYKRLPDDGIAIQPTILNTFFQNNYCGCTMVLNIKLLNNIIFSYKTAGKSLRVVHDTWAVTVAQATGEMIYDANPYMDFRRHDNNTSTSLYGKNIRFSDSLKVIRRMRRTISLYDFYKGYTAFRARLVLKCFGDCLSDEIRNSLELLGNYNKSIKNWLHFIVFNPLGKYYGTPKFFTWLRLVIRIY